MRVRSYDARQIDEHDYRKGGTLGKFQRGDEQGHYADHTNLWEALIFLNRKVMRLEEMMDEGED